MESPRPSVRASYYERIVRTEMKVLDGDAVRLKDAKGRKTERDIVQVYIYTLVYFPRDEYRLLELFLAVHSIAMSMSVCLSTRITRN